MEPVSKLVPGGIESKYYDIPYRPGNKNFSLDVTCSSILTHLSFMDIKQDPEIKLDLMDLLNQALVQCKTEEEINNLKKFMQEAAKVGGYAVEFYNEIENRISMDGRNQAIEDIRKPVSKAVPGGIESRYFNIKYRPSKENYSLNIACEKLLSHLAFMDVRRDENTKYALMAAFELALLECKTDRELSSFGIFMLMTKDKGGYAFDFYEEIHSKINRSEQSRIEEEEQEWDEIGNEMDETKKEPEKTSEEVEKFLEKYDNIKRTYSEIMEEGKPTYEDVEDLLTCFTRLNNDVDILYREMPKEEVTKIEEELEKYINNLKKQEEFFEGSKVWTM